MVWTLSVFLCLVLSLKFGREVVFFHRPSSFLVWFGIFNIFYGV